MRAALPLMLALSGCVSMRNYKLLEEDYEALAGDVEAAESELLTLQQRLAAAEAATASHVARADQLDALARDLQSRNMTLQASLGEVQKMLDEMGARSAQDQKRKEELEAKLGALQDSAAQAQTQAEEARARLAALEAEKAKLEAKTAAYDQLVASLQSEIASGEVTVKELRGKLTVNLSNAILFDSGSWDLKPAGVAALEKVAGVLAGVRDREIRVEGHTDDVPVARGASYRDNWGLSALRASAVVTLLTAKGVAPDNIAAVGYGEFHPIGPNDTAENRAANRRTEIVLVPRLESRLAQVDPAPAGAVPPEAPAGQP